MKKTYLLLVAILITGFLIAEAIPSPAQRGATPIYESALVETAIRIARCTFPAQPVVAQQPADYGWPNAEAEERTAEAGQWPRLERDV